MRRKTSWPKLIISSFLIIILIGCSNNTTNADTDNNSDNNNSNTSGKTIEQLNVGDKVVDPNWTWEFKQGYGYTDYNENEVTEPVVWIVAAKNHYMDNSITLIAENLIGFYYFDATTLEGMLAGYNHWGNSGLNASTGLRPWLNSTDQHTGDGFYNAFSSDFKNIILPTTIDNAEYDTGNHYTTIDNVFIPSHTELGDTEHLDTFELGKVYEYFIDADYVKLRAKILGESWERDYWTRSPYTQGYRPVGMMSTSGIYVSNFADFNNVGVRPVVNISSNTKISNEPNENGVYEIVY